MTARQAPWWRQQLRTFWFPASLLLSLLGVFSVIQLARLLEISQFGAVSFLAVVALQVVIWRAGVWTFNTSSAKKR